jgi:hypothetical protein
MQDIMGITAGVRQVGRHRSHEDHGPSKMASRRRGALRWSSTRFRLSWLGPYPMSISTMITHGISWREQCSLPVKRL